MAGARSPLVYAGYTYLMQLTYDWYLADSKTEKSRITQEAERFRNNGYMYTFTCEIDKNIHFMPNFPTRPPTMEEHYFRNQLNIEFKFDEFQKLQNRLPENLKWVVVVASLHQNYTDGGENVKYVSADGHFEIVFNAKGVLQTESNNYADMGTYNFCGSNVDVYNHYLFDMHPYYMWANTAQDYERRNKVFTQNINEIKVHL